MAALIARVFPLTLNIHKASGQPHHYRPSDYRPSGETQSNEKLGYSGIALAKLGFKLTPQIPGDIIFSLWNQG